MSNTQDTRMLIKCVQETLATVAKSLHTAAAALEKRTTQITPDGRAQRLESIAQSIDAIYQEIETLTHEEPANNLLNRSASSIG